jgi:hypothetical protein
MRDSEVRDLFTAKATGVFVGAEDVETPEQSPKHCLHDAWGIAN